MKVFCIFFMIVNMYGIGIHSLLENIFLNLIIRIFLVLKKCGSLAFFQIPMKPNFSPLSLFYVSNSAYRKQN
jgi:hypothetical protein